MIQAKPSFVFAQITDSHIVPQGDKWIVLKSDVMLKRLELVVSEINAMQPSPSLVIHSGDIVDSPSNSAYLEAKSVLNRLTMPYYVAAGNHDGIDELRVAFSDHAYLPKSGQPFYTIENFPVRFVVLDTTVLRKAHGFLSQEQLLWLQKTLNQDQRDTVICMHHFPCHTYYKLFNELALLNPDDLRSIIKDNQHVIGIITGHFHVTCATTFENRLCWVSPSVGAAHYFPTADAPTFSAIRATLPSFSLHLHNGARTLVSTAITVGDNIAA